MTVSQDDEIGRDGEAASEFKDLAVPEVSRPDRGWQQVGDVALRVVKAAVVAGAIRGVIPRAVASRIISSKTLKGA